MTTRAYREKTAARGVPGRRGTSANDGPCCLAGVPDVNRVAIAFAFLAEAHSGWSMARLHARALIEAQKSNEEAGARTRDS